MSRRPPILTPEVLAGIPGLIEQGLRRTEIAERLGCKLSTLQVRCSNAGISLRGRKRLQLSAGTPLLLSREAMASLRAWAVANGCSEAELASELLETIARDNLYDAVLDSAKPAKSPVVLPEMRGANSSTPSLPSARINAGPTPCRAERKQSGPQA